MVEFATLVMGVESRSLVKGEQALNSLAQASGKTEAAVNTSMAGVGVAAEKAATRVATSAQRMDGATRAATSNLTFQLQDIAMMLAAGQNPFMLAMQQGTQVAGTLDGMRGGVGILRGIGGAFAGLLSPVSLASVAIIGFGAAAIQWLTGTEEQAKTLDESLGDLARSVSDLRDVTGLLNASDLSQVTEQYGGLTAEVRELLNLQRELALMDAMKAVAGTMDAARSSMNGWITSELDGIRSAFDTTYDNARSLQAMMQQVAAASNPQEALDSVVALRQQIEGTVGPLSSLTGSAYEMASGLVEAESQLRQVVVQADRSESSLAAATAEATNLTNSAPGPGWMGAAIGETNALISRLIQAKKAQDALSNLKAVETQGLASQYAQYGMGRQAFNEGAKASGSLYNLTAEVKGLVDEMDNLSASAGSGGGSGGGASRGVATALRDAAKAAEQLRKEADRPLISAIDGVSNAFGNFVSTGLSDFKGFTQSIVGSFQRMIADMIATAAKNRIMIALGIGGGMAGTAANAAGGLLGGGGGLLGGLGSAVFSGGTGALGLPSFGGALGALGPIGLGLGAVGLVAGLLGGNRRRRRQQQAQAEAQAAAAQAQAEAQAAQAEAQERYGLETRLLQAQGDVAGLRRRELEALNPANRAIAEFVQRLEDETRIRNERNGLEEQLLRLQGNEVELRNRALAALDPSNRALQTQIWALEDAEKATQSLTSALSGLAEENFATALEYNRARGALASGGPSAAVSPGFLPSLVASQSPAQAAAANQRSDDILAAINTNIAWLKRYAERWDGDALPVRVVA